MIRRAGIGPAIWKPALVSKEFGAKRAKEDGLEFRWRDKLIRSQAPADYLVAEARACTRTTTSERVRERVLNKRRRRISYSDCGSKFELRIAGVEDRKATGTAIL